MPVFFITKYALSDGIEEIEFDPKCVNSDGRISRIDSDPWRHHFYNKNDYRTTKTAAIVRANQMREAKITSLKKQIAKLDKMKFT
jgi:hypothetical protein